MVCGGMVAIVCMSAWLDILTLALALRATSHMSQGSWPWNGEGPWLSSKGCTMGVEKAIWCCDRPSNIMWSENGPCWGTIVFFIGGKRGTTLLHWLHIVIFIFIFHFLLEFNIGVAYLHNVNTGQRKSSPKFRAPSVHLIIRFSSLQAMNSPDSLSICLAKSEIIRLCWCHGHVNHRYNCMISLLANHMDGGSRTGCDLLDSSTTSF